MKTSKTFLTAAVLTAVAGSAFATIPTTMNNVVYNSNNSVVAFSDTSTAVGSNVNSTSENFVAVGNNVTANGNKSVAVGLNATANGNNSVAIGLNSKAMTVDSIAIGNNASITTREGAGIAIGRNSEATELGTAVGTEAKATDWGGTALGTLSKATGNQSTAVGNNATAPNAYSTAVGVSSTASGMYSNAMGITTVSSGWSSTAIGSINKAEGSTSTAIGFHNTAKQDFSTVIGAYSDSTGKAGVVAGSYSNASATDSVVLGNNATADVVGSVALGSNSTTDAVVSTATMTVNGTEHTLAGGTADSTVSIGTTNKVGGLNTTATDRPENYVRTLTNMAAGRVSATSTDGVNGSQLHAVVEEVNKTADAVNTLSASAVRGAGKNLTVATTNGERTLALSDNLTDMGSATFGPNTGIYPSNTIISKDGMVVNSVDTHTMISGTSVVIENGNILENTTLDRTGLRVSNNDGGVTFTTNNIYAGEQRIHGVVAGTVDTDAVNVEQLNRKVAEAKTSATAGNGLTVTESKNANGSTNYEFGIDPSITGKINANTDAIAGLTTKVVDNAAAIDTLKGDVVKAKTTVTGSGVVEVTSSANENGSTNYNVSVNTDGIREIAKTSNRYAGDDVVKVERWNNPTGGADLTTFKFDAEKAAEKINVAYNVGGTAHTTTAAKGLGFVDGNHITTTTDANGNIQFNLDASVTDGIATNANGIKANADAIKATNDTVAGLSTKVADNTKAIKANADGVKANADAITGLDTKVADNVKAIKANADGVKANADGVKANADGVKANADAITGLDTKVADNANAIKANADAIKVHDTAIDTLKGDVVKAKTTVTAGNGTVVTTTTNPNGSTNYTLGLDKAVTDQIDNNSKGIQANAEAIKDLAKANNALATETAKGLNGLNGRVDSLASKVDANQKEARRGIASASALAALHPLDYNPEHKVDVMAGVGHYRGNTAVALGAAYRPNENVMFTVGASINGKDSAINAGVSYKVGTKDGVDYKYSKVAMQRHIDELNTTVAEQNQKIEQLNNLVEKLLEEVHQSK